MAARGAARARAKKNFRGDYDNEPMFHQVVGHVATLGF
jgi:hypothetical protein